MSQSSEQVSKKSRVEHTTIKRSTCSRGCPLHVEYNCEFVNQKLHAFFSGRNVVCSVCDEVITEVNADTDFSAQMSYETIGLGNQSVFTESTGVAITVDYGFQVFWAHFVQSAVGDFVKTDEAAWEPYLVNLLKHFGGDKTRLATRLCDLWKHPAVSAALSLTDMVNFCAFVNKFQAEPGMAALISYCEDKRILKSMSFGVYYLLFERYGPLKHAVYRMVYGQEGDHYYFTDLLWAVKENSRDLVPVKFGPDDTLEVLDQFDPATVAAAAALVSSSSTSSSSCSSASTEEV